METSGHREAIGKVFEFAAQKDLYPELFRLLWFIVPLSPSILSNQEANMCEDIYQTTTELPHGGREFFAASAADWNPIAYGALKLGRRTQYVWQNHLGGCISGKRSCVCAKDPATISDEQCANPTDQ
jgi:hypothetical protein